MIVSFKTRQKGQILSNLLTFLWHIFSHLGWKTFTMFHWIHSWAFVIKIWSTFEEFSKSLKFLHFKCWAGRLKYSRTTVAGFDKTEYQLALLSLAIRKSCKGKVFFNCIKDIKVMQVTQPTFHCCPSPRVPPGHTLLHPWVMGPVDPLLNLVGMVIFMGAVMLVIAKKCRWKLLWKWSWCINKNTWRQGRGDKSSHWSFHDLYVASPDPSLVPEQRHFLSCLYGDHFKLKSSLWVEAA